MNQSQTSGAGRWDDYVLYHGDQFSSYWGAHLGRRKRDVLYVLGKGFDPRMNLGFAALLSEGGSGKRDCLAIEFDEGPASPSHAHSTLVAMNWSRLQDLAADAGSLEVRTIPMWSADERRTGPRNAASVLADLSVLGDYTDLVIDISAMPRGVYFPLIGQVLHLLDERSQDGGRWPEIPNLHVSVAENPILDERISDEGVDDSAEYLYGFGGGVDREAAAVQPKVWLPIMGEGQRPQLERVYDLVAPDEVAPALPFPSLNPRRADDLILEYREFLFDRLAIGSRSFIYVSEQNPFDAYRQLRTAVLLYKEALHPLGGCKSVLSANSTKLLSLGALLAAYELKRDVGVAHVGSQGFVMDAPEQAGTLAAESELFGLWLSGECYER